MLPFQRSKYNHYQVANPAATGTSLLRKLTTKRDQLWICLISIVLLVEGIGIFMIGRWSVISNSIITIDSPHISLSTVEVTFHYNRSFSYPPSELTNAAWEGIYPERGTYFMHEPEVPARSTFSVFHQLHCLDGIRQAYWQAYDAATEGRILLPGEIPMMSSASHVRHCIDLLRQTLICHADVTIEIKDEDTGGVHGFGVTHQCKDWDQLMNLMTDWQI